MAFELFLTGATGHIGDTVFQTLVEMYLAKNMSIMQRAPGVELKEKHSKIKNKKAVITASTFLLKLRLKWTISCTSEAQTVNNA